jgi:WD40 repeat protein
VFEAATGTELARVDHDGAVFAVVFSPDGTRVATASGEVRGGGGGSARVFEAATGTELARVDHDGAVFAVVFSPDGTRVATASDGGSARVFEAATGTELARVDHDGDVNAVVFSPDGTQVATASVDKSARMFEAATGTELARLEHDGAVSAVVFSPDGTQVATASGAHRGRGGSARVYEATPDLLVQRAIDVMIRTLNTAELRRYSLSPDCRHVQRWLLRGNAETAGRGPGNLGGAITWRRTWS